MGNSNIKQPTQMPGQSTGTEKNFGGQNGSNTSGANTGKDKNVNTGTNRTK